MWNKPEVKNSLDEDNFKNSQGAGSHLALCFSQEAALLFVLYKWHCLPKETLAVLFLCSSAFASVWRADRTPHLPSHTSSSFLHWRILWCLGCNRLKAEFQGLLFSSFIVLLATMPGTQCQVLGYLALAFGGQQSHSEIIFSWFEWLFLFFFQIAVSALIAQDVYFSLFLCRLPLHSLALTDNKKLIFTITFTTVIKT